MRLFLFLILFLVSTLAQSGELEQAYEKEFAYLVAEKKALQQRLEEMHKQQDENLQKVVAEINVLQKDFLKNQNQTDRLNRQIVEASRGVDHVENDSLLLDTTLSQAKETLKKLGSDIRAEQDSDLQLAEAFTLVNKVIVSDGEVSSSAGQYFMPNGEVVNGKILNVGRIAKYGLDPQAGGILAPAGNGEFKVWSAPTKAVAQQLAENLYPTSLDVFLFDNAEKGIEKDDEKTFKDDVKASGMVGEVIIGLGLIGLLLVLIRIFLLNKAKEGSTKSASKNIFLFL